QFRRHRCDRRGGARPFPLGDPARAVLLGAPALRGRARSALARNLGGAAHHRDRSDQGDRSRACQGSPPRSQAHGGRGRGRRRGGGGRGGISARPRPPEQTQSPAATPGFSIAAGRTQGGANLLLEKEKDAEEMSRRSHNYARFAKKMKPTFGAGSAARGDMRGRSRRISRRSWGISKSVLACLAILGGAGLGGLAAGFNARAGLSSPQLASSTVVVAAKADMAPSDSVNLRFPADW